MDEMDRVLNKLDKIQDDLTNVRIDQASANENIARNTKDLSDHIEGVQQNRTRIQALEAPKELWDRIKAWTTWAGGLVLLSVTVYTLIQSSI